MDTLLAAGDHKTDSRGLPVRINGERELIQQAMLRLSIRKGSFAPDPSLGSELYRLRPGESAQNDRLALSYAQDALGGLPGVTVRAAFCRMSGEQLTITVELVLGGRKYLLEVPG